MKPENWDTSGGQYTYKGAEFGKSNTDPPADTDDWEDTRQEAASESRSAANEAGAPEGYRSDNPDDWYDTIDPEEGFGAAEPFNPDDWIINKNGMFQNNTTGKEISQDDYERMSGSSGIGGTVGNWGGSPPPISLPPTQPPPVEKPSADKEYYDKLVNPDKFQNAPSINLPPSYGKGKGPGSQSLAGAYHEYQGRKYDADPDELKDEYGNNLMGSQGIDSNAGGLTVADVRGRGTSPAQIQALVNNAVADAYEGANQGLGGMTSARPGMSGDIGSYAQQALGPQVAARMAAGQAQIDIPWQYAMQHADSVRQRRDLAHKLGLDEAQMITGDYYDYLGDKMGYADTDNQIMRQMYGEMPDAFV
jgi:hypothetical protein